MDAGRNGYKNDMEEVKELFREALYSATINSVEEKLRENGDVPTTTTTTTKTEEAIYKIPAVEHFFNYSNPTKEFESFK